MARKEGTEIPPSLQIIFFPDPAHKQPLFNSAPHFPRYGLKLFAMKLLNAKKKKKKKMLKENVNQGISPSATTSVSANFIFPIPEIRVVLAS